MSKRWTNDSEEDSENEIIVQPKKKPEVVGAPLIKRRKMSNQNDPDFAKNAFNERLNNFNANNNVTSQLSQDLNQYQLNMASR